MKLLCKLLLLTFLFRYVEAQEYQLDQLKFESDSIDLFINYNNFIVKYDTLKKIPFFTIHNIYVSQILSNEQPSAKRRNNFFVDDKRLKNKSATNRDYKGSGYDRGHMVPAGDYVVDQEQKDRTFVLSNICPQNPKLNRGIWANLENRIRDKVISLMSYACIITGSICEDEEYIGDKVGIPEYFYKLIYFPEKKLMYAFMLSNHLNFYSNDLTEYQVKVNDIEKITGEDFFDKLDDEIENKLESMRIPIDQ